MNGRFYARKPKDAIYFFGLPNGLQQYTLVMDAINSLSNELKAVYLAQLDVYGYGNILKSLLVEPSSHGFIL